jgi:pyruvate/2-oxoglutarate dehydrogenase complex dihydrolipoamide acyltransferase (E2) component
VGNLELVKKRDVSPFRKVAIGTWRTAYDPSVYGSMTLRMEKTLAYLEAYRAATGKKLNVTHMMARAIAAVFQRMPDANAILRFHRIYKRKRIGVFFQVVLEDPKTGEIDLSGCTIYDPEKKTLGEIVDEFSAKVGKVRTDTDKELGKSRNMFRSVPFFLMGRLLRFTSFLSYTLNLNLRWAGIPRDPFGSIMVTNIGSLGLEEAYAPLVPYSRVPLILAMGAIEDVPVVENGVVVPGKTMRLCATFDHRILDGAHAAVMSKTLRAWFEDPFAHFDPIPSHAATQPSLQAGPAAAAAVRSP